MDNVPAPFRIGSSESSESLSDHSYCYSDEFTEEPAEYDPQVSSRDHFNVIKMNALLGTMSTI